MVVCDYIVERIDGDYAHLRRTDEPEEELKMVARALLPPEIVEGSMLHYEWMQYTLIEEKTMTLQQLKYALTIADCNSINEASKQLFISQPSLSETIRELETELGFDIFLRSNRGIVITPEGEEFLAVDGAVRTSEI